VVVSTVGVYANMSSNLPICVSVGEPVWIRFVSVSLEPHTAWLVGGLIGWALHA